VIWWRIFFITAVFVIKAKHLSASSIWNFPTVQLNFKDVRRIMLIYCVYSRYFKNFSSYYSPTQELGCWHGLASLNSTFCMVYQDFFFLWAYTKHSASALILLPSFPYVQTNLVCIFLFGHSSRRLLILFLYLSSKIHPVLCILSHILRIAFLFLF
jgi:hypothetical protein